MCCVERVIARRVLLCVPHSVLFVPVLCLPLCKCAAARARRAQGAGCGCGTRGEGAAQQRRRATCVGFIATGGGGLAAALWPVLWGRVGFKSCDQCAQQIGEYQTSV
jgi:hypothetical protein